MMTKIERGLEAADAMYLLYKAAELAEKKYVAGGEVGVAPEDDAEWHGSELQFELAMSAAAGRYERHRSTDL
ncbi:MAG: thioredoxin domain-containing protein [Acidobacteriaceae bacterium]